MATRIGIAVVQQQDCVLVGVRDDAVVLAGMHEFPGGKCLDDEPPAACAVRECLEETGLRTNVVELLNHTRHDYPHGTVELFFFLCRLADGEQAGEPHPPFAWMPIAELTQGNFPEGNRSVIQQLMDNQFS